MIQGRALLGGAAFTLAHGSDSSYYFDAKQVTLDPEGARLVGEAMLAKIREVAPEANAVAGLTLGADPIISAVVLLSGANDRPLTGLIVRKERKARGTNQWVEGRTANVSQIVVVDDVVTTGSSAADAIEKLRNSGFEVVYAVALIDRLSGFAEKMRALGIPSASVFTLDDFKIPDGEGLRRRTAASSRI